MINIPHLNQDFKEIHFNALIDFYRTERDLNNKEIAKTLKISQSTFYRYKNGQIPDENKITSSKRKVIIRYRGLLKRKKIDSPKIFIPNFKIVNRESSFKLTKKQRKTRRLRSKVIVSLDYFITARCNCINVSDDPVTHTFSGYMDSLRSDNKILDFMINRHNAFWKGHQLKLLTVTSVNEVPSLVVDHPFQSRKAKLLRSDEFQRNLD